MDFLKNLFNGRFINSQSFCPNSAVGKSPKKYYFYISFWCPTWDTNPSFTSNKPTHLIDDSWCHLILTIQKPCWDFVLSFWFQSDMTVCGKTHAPIRIWIRTLYKNETFLFTVFMHHFLGWHEQVLYLRLPDKIINIWTTSVYNIQYMF